VFNEVSVMIVIGRRGVGQLQYLLDNIKEEEKLDTITGEKKRKSTPSISRAG
jgi:hypothetical protein